VVVVPVRQRDQVDALRLLLVLGATGIVEEGIDVDALSAGRVEAEGVMAEPGQGDVGH
jgi:hypothetical protein